MKIFCVETVFSSSSPGPVIFLLPLRFISNPVGATSVGLGHWNQQSCLLCFCCVAQQLHDESPEVCLLVSILQTTSVKR